ncbi:hypothetical protein [Arthrobacter sp. 18067]|uniref:hypothetical protein n=1 Tax=Arthrobacter sp. 18067 TaxID=2681413 RepID=UPI00135A4AE2|nr:hypothetical protein [Arthrobacter sp. 18067]
MRHLGTKFRQAIIGVFTALGLLLLGVAPSAQADSTQGSQVLVVNDSTPAADSTLEIVFDEPLSKESARDVQSSLADKPLIQPRSNVAPPLVHGPALNQNISCKIGNYRFSDTNGAFQIRNNCPYNNANWSYQISSLLRGKITSNVSESGLVWYKAGVRQGKNAPHTVPANYYFHGTMSNVRNYETVTYGDQLSFRVLIAGRAGSAVLTIGGTVKMVP